MATKSKKKRSAKRTQKKKAEESFIVNEIVVWFSLALCVLLMLSVFGFGGTIGGAVSALLKNTFGFAAFLFPFVLFGIIGSLIVNKGNKRVYIKVGAMAVLFVVITCMFELLISEGGNLGAGVENVLVPTIGFAGAFVVSMVLFIICIVLLTEKSALKGVKYGSNRAYSRAKETAERRRNAYEERRKQTETISRQRKSNKTDNQKVNTNQRRTSRYVEGVSFNTTLAEKKPVKSPEMQEITAKPEFEIQRAGVVETVPAFEPENAMMNTPVLETKNTIPEVNNVQEQISETPMAENQDVVSKKRKKKDTASVQAETEKVQADIDAGKTENAQTETRDVSDYKYPTVNLLRKGTKGGGESNASLQETAAKLEMTLRTFGVNASVTNVSCGPAVTRYELQPEMGVKVSKIVGLADDIKLNLAAADIRIEAPIPGKAAVGIEVPNKENSAVMLRELIDTNEFKNSASKISFAVGKDISGKVVITDIAKMPHVLIAGATGSGKSVCINTLIMSILYKARPDEVKLIMIDPKVVELSVYNGIPHLLIPVVTDPKKAAGALNWAVAEMTRRYQKFAEFNVRDMKGFNEKIRQLPADGEVHMKPMYQLVVIVDELADLMMVASKEVEESICRLAQLARAAGIHLVVATQRPSVNVITGLIKANMPSRIAFSVTSGVDSRTIIDMNGAEKLLGKGDMLFYPTGYPKPIRVQGSFVSDQEVQKVVEFLKDNNESIDYDEEVANHVNSSEVNTVVIDSSESDDDRDAYFTDAGRLIVEKEKASIGMLQRAFKIGFNRAARIMDQLCEAGVVGGEEGTKPRKVLMTIDEFEQFIQNQ